MAEKPNQAAPTYQGPPQRISHTDPPKWIPQVDPPEWIPQVDPPSGSPKWIPKEDGSLSPRVSPWGISPSLHPPGSLAGDPRLRGSTCKCRGAAFPVVRPQVKRATAGIVWICSPRGLIPSPPQHGDFDSHLTDTAPSTSPRPSPHHSPHHSIPPPTYRAPHHTTHHNPTLHHSPQPPPRPPR